MVVARDWVHNPVGNICLITKALKTCNPMHQKKISNRKTNTDSWIWKIIFNNLPYNSKNNGQFQERTNLTRLETLVMVPIQIPGITQRQIARRNTKQTPRCSPLHVQMLKEWCKMMKRMIRVMSIPILILTRILMRKMMSTPMPIVVRGKRTWLVAGTKQMPNPINL